MRTILRGAAMLAGLFVLSAPLVAQGTPRGLAEVPDGGRRGFWAGLGLGAGGESFDLRDGLGYSEALYRPTLSLRLGGTVNSALRLGGEALVWFDERGPEVETLSSLLFVGQFYPMGDAGLYVKGGVGLGRHASEFDGAEVGDNGFAGLIGAGYELPLSRRVFLVPSVDLVQHRYSERDTEGYRERLVNFGLAIVFQAGR